MFELHGTNFALKQSFSVVESLFGSLGFGVLSAHL
jgi:hypothetical protein